MKLHFAKVYDGAGFPNKEVMADTHNSERVVRELLQNAVDAYDKKLAAAQNRENCYVKFDIRNVPKKDIPGIKEYEAAFRSALQRKNIANGIDAKQTVDRIEAMLDMSEVPVLMCADNGIGVDEGAMEGLLFQGVTGKPGEEAGKFGIGHTTAFEASDLRYVVYAGRNWYDRNAICAGHAILAGHAGSDGRGRSAHGHYLKNMTDNFFEKNEYGTPPPLLQDLLAEFKDGVGTVVAMYGFNYFFQTEDAVSDIILGAAAKHFFPRIKDGKMNVEVESGGSVTALTSSTLEATLVNQSSQRQNKDGFISGSAAHLAYKTYKTGRNVRFPDADIRVTTFDEKQRGGARHEFSIFRSGMWITRGTGISPGWLEPLAGCKPFNAYIECSPGTKFNRLVKEAEGVEHKNINNFDKMSPHGKRELREIMKNVLSAIASEVGLEEADDVFSPANIAIIVEGERQKARKVDILRDVPQGSKPQTRRTQDTERNPGKKLGQKDRPAKKFLGVTASMSPFNSDTNSFTYQSCWNSSESLPKDVNISVRKEAVADPSCEGRNLVQFYEIARIVASDGTVYSSKSSTSSVNMPFINEECVEIFLVDVPDGSMPLRVEVRDINNLVEQEME